MPHQRYPSPPRPSARTGRSTSGQRMITCMRSTRRMARSSGSIRRQDRCIESSPAIGADGTIYVGSHDDNLYALNPADGSLKWKYRHGTMRSASSPAIGADGTIYVGSEDDNLYALNPADGSLKWKYATGIVIDSSPALGADGTIYVGSEDDNLYALNPADGSLKWKYTTRMLDCLLSGSSARTARSTSGHVMTTSMRSTRRMARCKWQYATGGRRLLPGPRRGRDDLRRVR